MIEIPLYQVDAFTDGVLWGNPAAVCPLSDWLPDELMQAIALEDNLPETAFIVAVDGGYRLRWFTPTAEVDLCGHATLGAAHVVFTHLAPSLDEVVFHTVSGPLTVSRSGGRLSLSFPALPYAKVEPPENLLCGLRPVAPIEVYRSMDYLAVYEDEEQMRSVIADPLLLGALDLRGVVVTAPGVVTDFSSRFFGPKLGIAEDPATGSAHCALVPYWARRLGKRRLRARQYSPRLGGTLAIDLDCECAADRVTMAGAARECMTGTIRLTQDDLVQYHRSR